MGIYEYLFYWFRVAKKIWIYNFESQKIWIDTLSKENYIQLLKLLLIFI